MILRTVRENNFKIVAECEDEDHCEFFDFLFGHLQGNFSSSAFQMLNLLENVSKTGPPRNTSISHQIKGPIFQFEKGRIRVLWFYDKGQLIICAHWFIKKSGKTIKTPKADIERAEVLFRRYFADKAKNDIKIIKKKVDWWRDEA
jgi:phage-related protein